MLSDLTSKKAFKTFFILFLIVLLGFLLRTLSLRELPIFGDEAIYIRWAQVMKSVPSLRFLPLSDGKQPLFMWSIIPFTKLFSDPLIAGRMVSVFTGIGTLIGVFFVGFLVSKSKKVGLIASLFYAVSPFGIFFDRLALADSMLAFFGVWTFVFGFLAFTQLRLDAAMLAGFTLGGALLTKSPGVFFVVLLPSLWVYPLIAVSKNKLRTFIKVVFLTLVSWTIGYALFNILRLGENFHMLGSRTQDYVWPYSHILKSPFDPLVPHFDRVLEYLWILGPGILIFFILYYLLTQSRKNFVQTSILALWSFGPIIAVSAYTKVMTARYVFFAIPFLIVFAASAFGGKNKLLRWKKLSIGIFVGFSLFLDFYFLTDIEKAYLPPGERSGYLEEWTAGTGIYDASLYLRDRFSENPSQKIVVGTEGYFGTLPDGLQVYLNDVPGITIIGVGIDIKDLPQSLIESKQSGNETYLLINESRLAVDSSKLGVEVVQKYSKAQRQKGSKEYNLFGPSDTLYLFKL